MVFIKHINLVFLFDELFLSALFGKISNSLIKTSGNLRNKMNNINMENRNTSIILLKM